MSRTFKGIIILSINEKITERNYEKCIEPIKQNELEEISIAFMYNTNAIDGSTITLPLITFS